MYNKEREKIFSKLWAKIVVGISVIGGLIAIFKEMDLFVDIINKFIGYLQYIYPWIIIINFMLLILLISKKENKYSENIENINELGEKIIALDERIKKIDKILSELGENCKTCSQNIDNFKNIQEKMAAHGIYDICLRENYNNDFYKNIYANTTKNLIISGHSLNNTINKAKYIDLRNVLRDAIIRVLRNGGTVKILLQTTIQNDISSYKKREWFNDFINELVDTIITQSKRENWGNVKTFRDRLLIKQIEDLRYLIVQTDHTTLISHYKMGQYNDNKNIYIFNVDPDEKFGACYLDDFNYVFDKCSNFVEESIEQLNRLVNI